METTTYILGTYDKRKAERYNDILNAFGVMTFDDRGNPTVVEAREKEVWFVDDVRTFYTFKAEVYKRDVKVVRRLVKNTEYPSSYIAELRTVKAVA